MSVDDATRVDGLGIAKRDGCVVLTISDHLTWDDEPNHFDLLEKKLGSYLRFINSGQLIEALPEAKGRAMRIELIHQYQPTDSARRFISAAVRQLSAMGIQLTSQELPDGY